MAGRSGKRRGPGRQVLGVASLTAVASGTTALVIGMGSAQVSQQLLTAPYADGSAGGPLVVDQPRVNVPVPRTDTPAPSSGQTGIPRAVGVARPVSPVAGPVVRPIAPAPGTDAPATPIGLPAVPGVNPVVPPVVVDPGTTPGRPLPGRPGTPGIEEPDDSDGGGSGTPGTDDPDTDIPDSPGSPGTDEPDQPGTDEPGVPATPADPSVPGDGTICGIDGGGMQLPQDVLDRLEEWLCGTTGRTVTVVANPLKLVSPVRAAVKVEAPAVRTPKHRVAKATRSAAAPHAETKTRAKTKAKTEKKAARVVAAPKPAAESRGQSRKHDDKREHEGNRGDRKREHDGKRDRGGRGHDRDDFRGLGQATGITVVVRHAEGGASWLHYSGRHRAGR
jgi:hypothetical protein